MQGKPTKTSRAYHIAIALLGIVAAIASEISFISEWLKSLDVVWLLWLARGLGFAAMIGAKWDVIKGKIPTIERSLRHLRRSRRRGKR
jgi:hypothetical protein